MDVDDDDDFYGAEDAGQETLETQPKAESATEPTAKPTTKEEDLEEGEEEDDEEEEEESDSVRGSHSRC